MDINDAYDMLLEHFGRQGWWPLENAFIPKEWEIIVGAILTQNTSWNNVSKALFNLKKARITSIKGMKNIDQPELENLIKPSGFYKQKAERLKIFAGFILSHGDFFAFSKKATRESVLSVKGVGRETADSILLYALGRPTFVVDAYSMRIFSRTGLIGKDWDYERTRKFFEEKINGKENRTEIYREFHALIVKLGKNICRKRPLCDECPLKKDCKKIL